MAKNYFSFFLLKYFNRRINKIKIEKWNIKKLPEIYDYFMIAFIGILKSMFTLVNIVFHKWHFYRTHLFLYLFSYFLEKKKKL